MNENETTLTTLQKIYQKFKSLKEEAEQDCYLDKNNLDKTGFNVTMNISKWIIKKTEWSRKFREFEEKRKTLYVKLYEFYDVEYPRKLSSKTEYDLHIESNPEYTETFNNCATIKEIIGFIDSIIETLKSKQWEVKAIISWENFKNGR